MIVFIDNYDAQKLMNKLVELHYGFTWNDTVKEAIIGVISNIGETETPEEHKKLESMIYDLEEDAAEDILPILEEYGFNIEDEP